jgi:hypothetical protein
MIIWELSHFHSAIYALAQVMWPFYDGLHLLSSPCDERNLPYLETHWASFVEVYVLPHLETYYCMLRSALRPSRQCAKANMEAHCAFL